jgi:hypothetical protein
MKKLFLVVMLSIFLSGCFTTTVTNRSVQPSAIIVEEWNFYWLFGLVSFSDNSIPCGSKSIASVRVQFTFLNLLFNGLGTYLLGLGSNTVETTCAV